jgi:hypothetical protein
MNIKDMKKRIYSILDIPALADESAVLAAIDSAARKIALYTKCIKKYKKIAFMKEKDVFAATLPEDFASFCYIRRGVRVYGRERFEIVSGKIKSTALCGECELIYFAYPPEACKAESDEVIIFSDDYMSDAAVYGAAMELCGSIRPGDIQRYMRIATEYDERMANMISGACANIANAFFNGMRGVFN